MKRQIVLTIALCFTVLAAAPAFAQMAGETPFASLDQDNDGRVSINEFRSYSTQFDVQAFNDADIDDNGLISPQEWEQYAQGYESGLLMPGSVATPYEQMDIDQDQQLTYLEFLEDRSRCDIASFEKYDVNANDVLSYDEWRQFARENPGRFCF
jgi:Ca2+-binding EF-hand superfamily protein